MSNPPTIKEVTNIDIAFGVFEGFLPEWKDIPEEYKTGKNEWTKGAESWFYSGLSSSSEFLPKEGVDPEKAVRMIHACLVSFGPKHEHKIAGVAYLLATFFEKIDIKPYKKEE